MIIDKIKECINDSLIKNNYPLIEYNIDQSKFIKFGDFNTNVAMVLKKHNDFNDKNPIDIANNIVSKIQNEIFEKIEIVKPGFINFTLNKSCTKSLFDEIVNQNSDFPHFEKKNEIATVEYVSANPTGFLHIGHARNAMFGEVISNLFEKVGYDVIRDYVVNDAGNQMNILATSVLVRYLQLFNKKIELPKDSYHGDEIKLVAEKLKEKYGDKFLNLKINDNFLIDDNEKLHEIKWFSRNLLLDIIKEDLSKLDIYLDEYFSEQTTHDDSNKIKFILDKLSDDLYEHEGATWFKSTKYHDDKDRVLIKSNGDMTYFLPDIYYHNYKITRKNNITQAVIVLGSDHYGYANRLMAVLSALGHKNINEWYRILFIQMVKLTKNGKEFKMSKRSGQSLTLNDLITSLGKNIAKWNLISSSNNNHLEIDVDIATKQDINNSYYYIKYAHERANNILDKFNFKYDQNIDFLNLNSEVEINLINNFHFYKQTLLYAIKTLDIQKIVNFILTIVKLFHSYYEVLKNIESNEKKIIQEKLTLVYCFKIILNNSLKILNLNLMN